MGSISEFIERHFRHFNAAVLKDAADAYIAHLDRGGKMMITLAGAMSTAELGVSLAEMIRRDKVHAITCTGANMEEDLFNLVARSKYERIPNYRELSPQQEQELLRRHLNRVTDTCIPEEEAMRRIERVVLDEWIAASENNERKFPHEFLYKILRECRLKQFYEIDPADSWMVAAAHKDLPLFVPGWEDSTLGNIYAARCITGAISNVQAVRSGIEYMIELADVVSPGIKGFIHRLFPNWRRHRRRFPHLRCAHVESGRGQHARARVGVFLPNQRFHHQFRLILRCGAE